MLSFSNTKYRAIQLSEEDVREAFANFALAMEGCCTDKGPVRKSQITEIKPVMAVYVSLLDFIVVLL